MMCFPLAVCHLVFKVRLIHNHLRHLNCDPWPRLKNIVDSCAKTNLRPEYAKSVAVFCAELFWH